MTRCWIKASAGRICSILVAICITLLWVAPSTLGALQVEGVRLLHELFVAKSSHSATMPATSLLDSV
jgi:hypothetical protein